MLKCIHTIEIKREHERLHRLHLQNVILSWMLTVIVVMQPDRIHIHQNAEQCNHIQKSPFDY